MNEPAPPAANRSTAPISVVETSSSTGPAIVTTPPSPSLPPTATVPRYAWYVLLVLALVNMVNFVDRNILAVLLEPIKLEFGLSDKQLGLLTGFAFIVVHSAFGLPLARLADRTARRSVIAWGVAIWSAMTAAMGVATSYGQLLFLRMGVGIGEAAGAPPSHSLLSDYFPASKRATALSLFGMGVYAGTMFGYLAAGWMGDQFGWRLTFVAVGIPGLLLALLVGTTVREPTRPAPAADESILFVLQYLASKPSFVFLMLAASCHAIAAYAAIMWTPTFYQRVHGLSLQQVGFWLGPVSGVGGALGALGGGLVADRLGRRDQRWYAWVATIVAFSAVPTGIAAYLFAGDSKSSLFAYFGFILMIGAYNGPLHAMNQFLARPRMRSVSVAIQLFIVNLIGGVVGPWVVGAISDALRPEVGELGIRHAMWTTVAVGASLASVFYFLTSLQLRRNIAEANEP
ncbi:MAG: MFS transporter [Myxococcota bacterium]